MKQFFNHYHFNSHSFPNKTSLSVSLLILTILLTACGGDSTENSTTGKEAETKKESKVDLSVHPNKWYKGSVERKIIVFENSKRPIADILNAMSTSIDQLKRCDGKESDLDDKFKDEITDDVGSCIGSISHRYNISSSDCDEVKRFLPKTTGILTSDFIKKSETALDELKIKITKREQVDNRIENEKKSKKAAEDLENAELSGSLSDARLKELLSKLKYEDDISSLNKLCIAQNNEAFFYIVGQVHKDSDKLSTKFDKQLIKYTPQNFSEFLKEVLSKKNSDEIVSLFRFISYYHQNRLSPSTVKLKSNLTNSDSNAGQKNLRDYSLCQKDIFEYAKTLSIKGDTVVLGWCISVLGTLKSEMAEDWLCKIYNESEPIHIQLLNKLKEKEIRKGVDGDDFDEILALYRSSLPYIKIADDSVTFLGEIKSQKVIADIKKYRLILQSIVNEPLAINKNINSLDSGGNAPYASAKYSFILISPYYSHQQALISINPNEAPTLFKEIALVRVASKEETEREKIYNDDNFKTDTIDRVVNFINCLGIEPDLSRGVAFGEVLNILNSNFKNPVVEFVIRQGKINISHFHAEFFNNIKSNDKAYEKVSKEILALWSSRYKLDGSNYDNQNWLYLLTHLLPNPVLINGVRNRLEESSGKEFLFYAQIFSIFKIKDSKVIQLIEKAIDELQKSKEDDTVMRLKITLKQIKEF